MDTNLGDTATLDWMTPSEKPLTQDVYQQDPLGGDDVATSKPGRGSTRGLHRLNTSVATAAVRC